MVRKLLYLLCVSLIYESTNGLGTDKEYKKKFLNNCQGAIRDGIINEVKKSGFSCDTLLKKFEAAWVGKDPCNVPESDYTAFITAASSFIPKDKSLFWSGTKAIAQSHARGHRMFTLETTLVGLLVNEINFCPKKTKAGDTTNGIDFEKNSCSVWNPTTACPKPNMSQFWNAASRWFAKEAKGQIYIMLSGGNCWLGQPSEPYRDGSICRKIELPAINKGKNKVTGVTVWLKHSSTKGFTCDSNNLKVLEKDANKKGLSFECIDNPKFGSVPPTGVNPNVKVAKAFVKSTLSKK